MTPFRVLILGAAALLVLPSSGASTHQKKKTDAGLSIPSTPASTAPLALTRTSTRQESRRLGYGGMLTLYGAPQGSVQIEGWPRSEAEITADIELRANTEEDLARLSAVNGFVLDADANHLRLITTGTHDRKFIKRVARDFPKQLLALPWKIDYRVRVPSATDLEIYTGRGAFNLAGVEGTIRLHAGESTGALALVGGDVEANVQSGTLSVRFAARNWRGRGVRIRLASGDLTVELPANFHADIDADVLRSGRVENSYPALSPREGEPADDKRRRLRSGGGGALLSFTVGDGTLRIKQEGGRER